MRANPSIVTPEYLYLWLNSRVGKYFVKRRGTGSTVQGIKQSELKQVEVLVPDKKILERINPVFENLFLKRANNFEEINALRQLKKILLPKLLTGEVRVKN